MSRRPGPSRHRGKQKGLRWWPDLLAACEQAAKDRGLPFAVWMRLAAAQAAGVPPDPRDVAAERRE